MLHFGFLLLLGCVCHVNSVRLEELAVVVLSQSDTYHSALAQDLKTSLYQQSSAQHEEKRPKVFLTHEDFPHRGAWTIVPILSQLSESIGNEVSWIIFCEERTRFNLNQLVSTLSQHDSSKEIWLGHGIVDAEPTIVHHFQFYPKPIQYPLLAAGFAVSAPMLKRLLKTPKNSKTHFSIDAMYELAFRIHNITMHSLPSAFCIENNHTECASYPLPLQCSEEPVPNEDIFFAVKTCLKFHKERVPVVQNTWGKDASNIEFFSDVQDDSVPTTPVGVANTKSGHCAKTKVILELALQRTRELPSLQWVVLADDDTLLSVPRLQRLLSCWSGQPVVVGERYGYDVDTANGYNYLTGGAGLAINVAVLPTLVSKFRCFQDHAPDDMLLGYVLTHFRIQFVHSPLFHQNRPMDYPANYLATQHPISFHKYWDVDPLMVYEQWFSHDQPKNSPDIHTEL